MRGAPARKFLICFCLAGAALAQPGTNGAGGVLQRLSVTTIAGSGSNLITAMTTDPAGNIYIAGSTSSSDLPVKNAAQAQPGEAEVNYSVDGGATWIKSGNPSQTPKTIQADPVNAGTVFEGGFDGLYKSADCGKSWGKVYSSAVSIAIYAQNPTHVYAISAGHSLVLSRDGGLSWTGTPVSGSQVLLSPWTQEVVAIITSGPGLTISRDGGVTWSSANQPVHFVSTIAFDPSHPGWIYAAGATGTQGYLALSMDAGMTWTSKSVPPSNFSAIEQLLPDPDQPNVLYASALGGLFVSADAVV